MKLRIIFLIAAAFALMDAKAQQRPQDYWHYLRSFAPGNGISTHTGIAAGNGKVYVGATPASGSKTIQMYAETGELLGTFGSFASINGIAVAPGGQVLVFDGGAAKFKLFNETGTFIREWGDNGSGDGAIGTSLLAAFNGIAIDAAGNVYFADAGNWRIQVYDLQGNFLRKWGKQGTLPEEFSNPPTALAVTPEGKVYTTDGKVYTRLGEYLESHTKIESSSSLGVSTDGGVLIGKGPITYYNGNWITPALLAAKADSLYEIIDPHLRSILPTSNTRGVYFGADGNLFALFGEIGDPAKPRVWVLARGYYQGNPPGAPAIPAPTVTAEQRPSTTLVDIDFKVYDADSENVRVAPLAFVGQSQDFSAILPMRTFVEGTETKVGLVAANQNHRLTWNAAADWDEDYGDTRIEILARDEGDLLGMHLIKLPAQGADSEVLISREPVTDTLLLPIWHWLIASGDESIRLENGRVLGTTGNYSGSLLAKGQGTTDSGRRFLYEKLNLRPITGHETGRALAGQYGFKSINHFSVARGWMPTPLKAVAWGKDVQEQTNLGSYYSVQKIVTDETSTLFLSEGSVVCMEASVPESAQSGVIDIAVYNGNVAAVKSDGTVVAWTRWNTTGAVVPGLSGVKAVAVASQASFALKHDGTVVRFGPIYDYALEVPSGLTGVTAISAGAHNCFALKQDGTVVGWGSYSGKNPPVGLSGVVAIAAGGFYTLALKSNGTVVSWGYTLDEPVPSGLSGVVAIGAGSFHGLALKNDGTVVAWGRNTEGQRTVPSGLKNVVKIGSGSSAYHTVVVQQTQ